MIVAIVFAHVWGVLQLIALGSFARTIRIRTALAAMAAGLYACATVALLMQFAWILPAARITGAPLGDVIRTALDTWWDTSGPVVFSRTVTLAVGAVVVWFWAHLGPLLSAVNFFTKIPPQWSYELAPLVALRARLMPWGSAILLLGLVVGLLWGVFGLA